MRNKAAQYLLGGRKRKSNYPSNRVAALELSSAGAITFWIPYAVYGPHMHVEQQPQHHRRALMRQPNNLSPGLDNPMFVGYANADCAVSLQVFSGPVGLVDFTHSLP